MNKPRNLTPESQEFVERNGNGSNGNGSNGNRMNGNGRSMSSGDLLEQIRQLGFVKVELELYLDTHPGCKVAIDYYHRTIDALAMLMEQYHAVSNNPLVAAGSIGTENWDWVNEPWPWFRQGDGAEHKRGEKR